MNGFIGRINAVHRSADNKWQMGANVSLSKQESSVVSEGTAYANPFFLINWRITPNIRIYDEDGNYDMSSPIIQAYFPKSHPIEDLQKDKNESNVFRSSNNLWASYEIIDGLILKEN